MNWSLQRLILDYKYCAISNTPAKTGSVDFISLKRDEFPSFIFFYLYFLKVTLFFADFEKSIIETKKRIQRIKNNHHNLKSLIAIVEFEL